MKKISILIYFIFVLLLWQLPVLAVSDNSFPRLANYYLKWELNETEAKELSRWDLLILDMEVQVKSANLLKKIRLWNPNIKILAYITPQEIRQDAKTSYSSLRRSLASGISKIWYLQNSSGYKLNWWPGTYLLNVTNRASVSGGERFNDYLINFVVDDILSTGLWDGVFYDNAWDNITHFVGTDIDLDNDGDRDSNVDSEWQQGMKYIYEQTRALAGSNYLILGNGTTREYLNQLNGKLLENFSAGAWANTMNTYQYNFTTQQIDKINIINANTGNSGQEDYQQMRFGLVSALLEAGYYSYDYGDQNHNQLWWYDEYNIDLGEALGDSLSQKKYSKYQADIWQRDFSNGLVVVNSTDNKQTVALGGEYEKIHGTQDVKINDGSIVTETIIDGYDGLILLKTFDSLNDVLFRNGDFVRFFDPSGERLRNGFFIFENGYRGGEKIAHIDLDGNGKRDLLVVKGNKIMAWRDDGQIFMKKYPYTTSYQGELQVALGDLNRDGRLEIYVAPSPGYPAPIKIYTRHGRQMKQDWYPFGTGYTGGYSIAVQENKTSIGRNSLVVAKASQEPLVSVFDYKYNPAFSWYAFDRWSNIGVNVAAGDLEADLIDEIVIGAGEGAKPLIRVFSNKGDQLYDEFTVHASLANPGIEVLTADVDYDGRDDIVSMSRGF